MGIIDVNWSGLGSHWEPIAAYFAVASILGAWRGKWGWLAWPSLGVCLYVVHLVAIAHGYKPPFVEANAEKAVGCFTVLLPCGLGIGMGAFFRLFLQTQVKSGGDQKQMDIGNFM